MYINLGKKKKKKH